MKSLYSALAALLFTLANPQAILGQSLDLDGYYDYVNVNTVAGEMHAVSDWAISFWVKPDLTSFDENEAYVVGINTSTGGNRVMIGVKKNGGYPVVWDIGSNTIAITGTTGLNTATWNHVVYYKSGTSAYLYLNGTYQGTNTPGYSFSNTDKWSLGMEYDGSTVSNEYAGLLDEVAIWDDALTVSEITALYNSGISLSAGSNSGNYTSASDLVGYWLMDEGAGIAVADSSGNNNSGTISGATWSTNTVTNQGAAPVATDMTFSVNEDTVYNGTIYGTDDDDDVLSFMIASNPAHGTVALEGCADFTISSLPFSHQYSNVGQGNEWDVDYSDGADVAYKLTLATGTTISVTTCAAYTSYDTKLQIFTADGQCVATATSYYNDDYSCSYASLRSTLPSCVLSAGTYYIVVDGYAGYTGNYQVDVTDVGGRNDNSQMAINDRSYELDKLRNDGYSPWDIDQLFTLEATPPVNNDSRSTTSSDFTYSPIPDFSGNDSFTFIASDGIFADTGTVSITVNSTNDDPVAGFHTALDLDGVDDYLYVSDFSNVPSSQLTISAWVKTTISTDAYIVQQGRSSTDANTEYVLRLVNGKLNFWDYNNNGFGFSASNYSNATVNSGSWTYICFVKNGTVGKYYINGVLDNTVSASLNATYSSNDFVIGKDFRDNNQKFAGQIDELRIWNTAHTDAEVQNYMYQMPAATSADLVGYWQLNRGTGDVAYDASSSANNASFHNMTNTDWVTSTNSVRITSDEDNTFSGYLAGTDQDNDVLTFTVTTSPANGTLAITNSALGAFSYIPNNDFNGSDSISYTVSDGYTTSSAENVSVVISPIPDAPVASNATATTDENTDFSGTVTASDADGDSLSFSIASNPSHGSVMLGSGAGCADFTISSLPFSHQYSNVDQGNEWDVNYTDGADVAYKLTLATGTTISVTTCAAYTSYDTKLQIFTADGQCVATATSYYNDDYSCSYASLRSTLPSCVLSAGTYYIVVDGYAGYTGNYQVDVTDVGGRNDNSQMAINDRSYELDKLRNDGYSPWEIDEIASNFNHSGSRTNLTYSYTYTPETDYNGSDSFTFIASDGSLSDTATVSITVNSVNNAPVATVATVSTAEDTDYSGTLAATDPDDDPMTFSLVTGVLQGTLSITDTTTGSFTYSPNSNYNGTDSFSFSASDGALIDTAVVTITITAVNDAPIAVSDTTSTDEDTDKGGTLAATDAENDAITYTIVTNPGHGTVTINNNVAGTYSYSPAANYNGSDSFTFQASDGLLHDSASVTITVNSVNDGPLASSAVITTNEDTDYTGTLTVADVDNDSLTITVNTAASNGSVTVTNASSGAYSYSPNANYNGSDSFILGASDGTLADTALITIAVTSVNDVPVAQDSSITLPENSVYTGILVATDLDNDSLTYSVSSSPTNGVVSITNAGSGAFTYTPTTNYDGTDSFNFLASDGSLSDDATISITILPVADPPVTADTTVTTPEDTVYSGTLTATDPNGDVLTFSILSATSNGTAAFSNTTTGAFTYSPDANYYGSDAFIAMVSDGGMSDTATVTITVTSVNDRPAAADASEISNEDMDYNGTLSATDVENDSLTFSVVVDGSNGTVVLLSASSGAYKYTPDPDYNGSDQFSFAASDASASDTATISITILPVNDAPAGVDLSFTTTDIVSYVGALSASDVENDSITFSILGSPEIGTVTLTDANTGVFSYSPMINYQGNDAFDFTASDGDLLDTATVTVTVNNVNAAPVASDFAITLEENGSVSDTLVAADIDGDLLSYAIANYPDHGYISLNSTNGTFSYNPDADYDGTDEFTFRANDGTVNSNAATVSVTITNINRGPTAFDSSYILLANMALSGVLSANDEDGDDLSFSINTNPSNGTVTLSNDLGCADYSIAALPFSHQSSNTDQPNNWNVTNSDGADIAYKLVLEDSTVISVSTCAPYTNFDTKLEIFTADNQCVATTTGYYNDDYNCSYFYYSSTLDSCALGPGIYYVVVDGYNGDTGNYQVDVAEVTSGRSSSSGQMTVTNDLLYELNKLRGNGYSNSQIDRILDQPAQPPVSNNSRTASVSDFTYTPNTDYIGSDEFTFIATDGSLADTATISLTVNLSNYPPVAGFGTALSFDGDDDFVQLSQVLSIGNTSSTIAAWIKIPEVGSDGLEEGEQVGVLFGNYPSSPNSRWSIDSNGKLRILWHNGQINLTGSTDLRDNTWHHLALVRDINTSRFYAYIDGAQELITGHDSAGDNEDFTATHRIGADNSPNPNNFHGMITELQIWNTAVTPTMFTESMVQQYMYLMPPADAPNLIANWHMDDASGTVVVDGSGNGIDGTLTNMDDSLSWVDSSVPIAYAIDEDMSFMAYLPGNDIDNDELTFIVESQPENGAVEIEDAAAGSFIYTPDDNFNGSESFSWKVSDGLVETAVATASITVLAVGDAPIAENMDLTMNENGELADTLAASDADGDSLLFTIVTDPSEGSLELVNSLVGAFTYVPAADYVGDDEFSYAVTDGESSDTATVSIAVTLVNYVPVAVNAHFGADRNVVYNGMLLGSDPDDNVTLNYSLISEPIYGTMELSDETSRSMEFTGTNNVNSGNSLNYQSMTVAFWAEPENSGRSYITRGSSQGSASERNWDIYGDGSDILFSVSNGTQEKTLSATHPELGDWHYIVATLDATGDSMQLFINNTRVAVDHDATVDPAYNKTMFVGGSANHRYMGRLDEVRLFNRSLTRDEVDQLYYGSHVGDGLQMYYRMNSAFGDTVFDSSDNGIHGTPNTAIWSNQSPVKDFTYITTTNSSSVDSFSYAVSDGELADTAVVQIAIDLGINTAPVAGYHTGLEFDGEDDHVDLGDIMGDGSYTKMVWVKRAIGNSSNNLISGSGNDHALWVPVFQGFKLSAAHNGSWDEPHVQDSEPLGSNQWYFVAVTFDMDSGGLGTMTLYKNGAVVDQAADVPVQNDGTNCYLGALSGSDFFHGNMDEASIWSRALGADEIEQYMYRTIAGNATGLVGYWHMDEGSGLTIRDATANEHDGDMLNMHNISSWATSNIAIAYEGVEDDIMMGYLPSYDQDGNQLTYSTVTAPAHGTVSFPDSVSGSFAYTPAENYHGGDIFSWKVSDGIAETEAVTIALTIDPAQDPPIAYNMFLSVEENTAYTDTLSGIDVDGDEVSFSIIELPVNGFIALIDTAMGIFTYNPLSNFVGNDMFSFGVYDGQSGDTAFAYLAVGMDSSITAQFEVAHSEIREGDTTFSISIVMNGSNLFDVFIPYTISSLSSADMESDFIASDGLVAIPAGDTESEIDIQIVDDDTYELPEEIIIMLGSSDNAIVSGNVSHFLKILDDDYPDGWDLNTADYEYYMFVTGIILGAEIGDDHFLGAFQGQDCRGLVTPVTYNNNQIFQMMVYSNETSEDNMSFRYYSAEDDSVYLLQQSVNFNSGVTLGTLDVPYPFTIVVLKTTEPEFIPEEYALYPAYPNPFNPATTISYDLPNDDMVSITIYDMMGREVRTLVSASQTAGRKSIRWDGTNNAARQVAAGIYLCVIQTPQYFKTNKIIMLK